MNRSVGPAREASHIADWIEMEALSRGSALGGDAIREIASSLGLGEVDVALATAVIHGRSSVLGKFYPFRVGGGGIAARDDAPLSYWAALLCLSSISQVRSQRIAAASVLFEKVVGEAMESFFGPRTRAVRFGWPSDVGRPQAFPDAVRWLAGLMSAPVGSAYRPPSVKDGGVDVVAWRPFGDSRSGFPVALVQCTLERDFRHKAADIDLRVWSGWLALDSDPISVLAVPEVVPSSQDWDSLATRVVVLDRLRLVLMLCDRTQGLACADELQQWVDEGIRVQRLSLE